MYTTRTQMHLFHNNIEFVTFNFQNVFTFSEVHAQWGTVQSVGWKVRIPHVVLAVKGRWDWVLLNFEFFHINCYNFMIFYEAQNFNLIGQLVSEIWIFKLILICKLQKVPMCIRFWSKTFNIFLYKFKGMYNNFKYGFHNK